MSASPNWDETVIGGKLFALLTTPQASEVLRGIEVASIDRGKVRLLMHGGRKFEITVRQL